MLKVYICDDDEQHRNNIKDIVNNTLIIENYDMSLELTTNDPYKLLDHISSSNSCGLYFLDINLNSNINGIQLAAKIREIDPRGFIVFITAHAEMSYLTFLYKVEAMDYILKDNFNNDVKYRIQDCIANAFAKYTCKSLDVNKTFSVKIKDKIVNINFDEIIFFETSSTIHKIILHCTEKDIEFYGQMKYIENKLDERFCKCHSSFIINKDKITEIDKKSRIAYMTTGDRCLISTRRMKALL